MLALMEQLPVKGMAHITGGGLLENIPRVLPENLTAVLRKDSWDMPPLFSWMQKEGNVAEKEMHRTFNCGIGMAVIVAADDAERAMQLLREAGETVWRIGSVEKRAEGQPQTVVQ
jgi:phosphoribosylformylglycinamidine cyclo-ligase